MEVLRLFCNVASLVCNIIVLLYIIKMYNE